MCKKLKFHISCLFASGSVNDNFRFNYTNNVCLQIPKKKLQTNKEPKKKAKNYVLTIKFKKTKNNIGAYLQKVKFVNRERKKDSFFWFAWFLQTLLIVKVLVCSFSLVNISDIVMLSDMLWPCSTGWFKQPAGCFFYFFFYKITLLK